MRTMIKFWLSEEYSTKAFWKHVLATSIVAGAFFVVFALACGITPFGSRSWLVFDMKTQYMDFYSWYKGLFDGSSDLFYCPAMTLGAGALGFFTYYLSSPLLLLLLPVPRAYLPEAVTVLAGLRFMLIAAACDAFLIDHVKSRSASSRMPATMIFALSYTFSSYMVAYAVNPMWMEVFALMPLVLWMHRRMFEEKKCLGYVITLALMLWCNYYIAFMVCIFIVLWTASCLIADSREALRRLLRTAACSVWGAALCAVVLIPTFLELFGGPKDAALDEGAHKLEHGLATAFSNLHIFAFDAAQTWWGEPLLWCGLMMLLLCFIYFFLRKVPLKEKLGMGFMLLFLSVSFCVPALNLMWHAGMEPSGYPYREAFLFVFLVIVCACRAWNLREKREGRVARYFPKVMGALQLALLLANAFWIFRVQTSGGMMTAQEYRASYVRELAAAGRMERTGLYRAETMQPRTQNDAMMFDYDGITHYSSAGLLSTRNFLTRLGFNDDGLYTAYGRDNTRTADALLSLRYVIDAEGREDYILCEGEGAALYENPYVIPPALALSEEADDTADDPFALQEEMLSAAAGRRAEVFIPAECKACGEGRYVFSAAADGEVYFYMKVADRPRDIGIALDDAFFSGYGNLSCQKILNLGTYKSGEQFSISLTANDGGTLPEELFVVTEDVRALKELSDEAKAHALPIERQSASKLTLTVPGGVDTAGVATTIPYETSWKISINGREVPAETIYDTFLYIPSAGAGDVIELRYVPEGLLPGALISLFALLLFSILPAVRRSKA